MPKKEIFAILKTEIIEIHLYAVRSKDGKWLRSKGQNGYGESWVDDFSKAKVWNRPGPAKGQVTFWGSNYPQYGVPDLVEIVSGTCNYLDQTERVMKSVRKKELDKASQKVLDIEYRINNYLNRNRIDQQKIDIWKLELEKANKVLTDLKGK